MENTTTTPKIFTEDDMRKDGHGNLIVPQELAEGLFESYCSLSAAVKGAIRVMDELSDFPGKVTTPSYVTACGLDQAMDRVESFLYPMRNAI